MDTNTPVVQVEGQNQPVVTENQPVVQTPNTPQFNEEEGGQFNTFLERYTQGKVKDFNKLGSYLQAQDQVMTLKPQLEDLQSKLKQRQYATELTERIDGMFRDKKPMSEIRQFVNLHFEDLDTMQPVDVIRKSLSLKLPGFTKEELDFKIEQMYPKVNKADYEEDDAGYDAAVRHRNMQIQVDSKESMSHIKGLLADVGDGQMEAERIQMEQRRAQQKTNWTNVVSSMVQADPGLKFDFTGDTKNIGGGQFDFKYTPSSPDLQAKIVNAVVGNAVQAGLELTEENLPKIKQQIDMLSWSVYREDFLNQLVTNMYSDLNEHFVQKYAGKQPVAQAPRTNPAPQKKSGSGISRKRSDKYV